MKKEALVSIIVPVYNVEKYIEKCLDSIIDQTYKNIEIILVDDGSTDSSGKICDEYAKKDKRIKVYHKENGGLSSARNYGIDKAKGEYLTFIDSDDTVELDYVGILYNLIVKYNTKMSICSYTVVTNNGNRNIGEKFNECLMNTEECLSNMYLENGFTVSACAKLYHKSLFKNSLYPVGRLYEDNGTTYKYILECDYIAYNNKSIYNYFIRKKSITNKKFSIKKMDYILLTDEACEIVLNHFPNLIEKCEYRKAVARLSILRQMFTSKLTNEEKKEQEKIIKYLKYNYKKIMKNKYASKRMKVSLRLLKTNKYLLKIGAKLYEKIK